MRQRALGAAAGLAAFFALAGGASAATICVSPATGCGQTATTISKALAAANSSGGTNTIRLGAKTYSEDDLVWNGPGKLTIQGAGADKTTIQRATPEVLAYTLRLESPAPVVITGVRIHVTGSDQSQYALRIDGAGPGVLRHVRVDSDPGAEGATGVALVGPGWTLTHSLIDMGGTNGTCLYSGGENERITDATLRGCSGGIDSQGGSLVAQRLQISRVSLGVDVGGGNSVLEDSLITATGDGLEVSPGQSVATLTARQDTIVGTSGRGVQCTDAKANTSGQFNLSDSIISGYSQSLWSGASAGNCDIEDTFNDYTGTATAFGPLATIHTSAHQVADPQFIDPSHGNYRLGPSSLLLNLDSAPLATDESATDLDGGLRIVGGFRDLGAYERPLAAKATTVSPSAIAQRTAKLSGTVNTGGAAASWRVIYGHTSAYGSRTTAVSLAPSMSDHAVARILRKLAPATVYHYRIVLSTPYGVTESGDATFKTKRLVARMILKSLRSKGTSVLARLACKARGATCAGKIKIAHKDSAGLGNASYSIPTGKTKTIRVPLNATGRSLLKHQRSVKTTIVVTLAQPGGKTTTFARRSLTLGQ
jgi:hypothetical protein